MRIRDLVKETGVPKQTIHYYIQIGLVPKAVKTGRNSAEYSQKHVDSIRLIKELQEKYFLPIPAIKKILKKYGRSMKSEPFLAFQLEFLRPLEQLLEDSVQGEAAFLKSTGLPPERLADYEDWGVITPEMKKERKHYTYDDLVIGRVIARWRDFGLTSENGFPPDIIKTFYEMFLDIVAQSRSYYQECAFNSNVAEEVSRHNEMIVETTALFFYRLYRKLAWRTNPAEDGPESESSEAGDVDNDQQ